MIEYPKWYQKQCRARTTDIKPGENGRCSRKRNHHGRHIADNTGYDLAWFDGVFVDKAKV